MGTRRNILSMPLADVQRLTSAFNVLKSNGTYDSFIQRHMQAMMAETPANDPSTDRNAAHRGPAFLPWHRAALLELANELRSVDSQIDDLPYWKWEDDTALYGDPRNSPLWTASYFGPDGDPTQNDRVLTGPFANWRALIYDAGTNSFQIRSFTGLIRRLGRDPQGVNTLPSSSQVNQILGSAGAAGAAGTHSSTSALSSISAMGISDDNQIEDAPKSLNLGPIFRRKTPTPTRTPTSVPVATPTQTPTRTPTSVPVVTPTQTPTATATPATSGYGVYDISPWDESQSTYSFRNRLEGWYQGIALHNQVHLYIGGDMLVGTSPNDPVFWLNHCNIDRIWALWQQRYGINTYRPTTGGPTGHNLDDTMQSLINPRTPRSVLDIAALGYTYA